MKTANWVAVVLRYLLVAAGVGLPPAVAAPEAAGLVAYLDPCAGSVRPRLDSPPSEVWHRQEVVVVELRLCL